MERMASGTRLSSWLRHSGRCPLLTMKSYGLWAKAFGEIPELPGPHSFFLSRASPVPLTPVLLSQ